MSQKQVKKTRVSEGAILPVSDRIKAQVEALRYFVDNFNTTPTLALRDGRYHELDKTAVYTTVIDGWTIGYKLVELKDDTFLRKVFVKVKDARLSEVSNEETKIVLSSVFEAAIEKGQLTEIEMISPDCLLISQRFQVMFWKENNPNLIVPGNPLSKAAV